MAENGLLTGFKMRWTMDEITSADLLYDAGSAKPGSEIWKKLAAEVMANVLGQHYFSELWHNGQRVSLIIDPGYGLERSGLPGGAHFYSAAGEARLWPGKPSLFQPTTRPIMLICIMTKTLILLCRRR